MTDHSVTEAHATYRAIIDSLVSSRASLKARLIREGRPIVLPRVEPQSEDARPREARKRDSAVARANLDRLSARDRQLVAALLDQERNGAIHDVLATLTWWLECREVSWSFRGEPMPHGYEGGLHCDYVGRCTDWQWPASIEPAAASVPPPRRESKSAGRGRTPPRKKTVAR